MMRVLGTMSGTSVDSIDVAVCEFWPDPERPAGLVMRYLGSSEQPFPARLRAAVFEVFKQTVTRIDHLTYLNFSLGEAFGRAALNGARSLGIDIRSIDLIASHGQTIYHLIEPDRRATLQMGEPALIAATTGRTVVANFRTGDMAAGGQGAPLVSFFDSLFFAGQGVVRAVQNIGGIGNVTFVAGGAVWAFDTGPGNMVLDYTAQHLSNGELRFDRDGAMASAGTTCVELLEHVLSHPYFSQPPPKTAGRERFGDAFARDLIQRAAERGLSPQDTMATFTAVTAESIARAYRRFGPEHIDEVIVSGGGARNRAMLADLRRRLPGARVVRHDDTGVPGDAKEAVAFALLGHEAVYARPANVPACTGATRGAVLGQITPGENFVQVMRRTLCEEHRSDRTMSLRLIPN